MGFKLTGIVIDKNFEKDLPELFELLNINDFAFEKDSTFDEETFDFLKDENLSIGFFGKGTFLSTGVTLMTSDELLKAASTNHSVASFYVNDTQAHIVWTIFIKENIKKKVDFLILTKILTAQIILANNFLVKRTLMMTLTML